MKLFSIVAFFILISTGFSSSLHAAPQFWTSEQDTPTPIPAPSVNTSSVPISYLTASPTPVIVPRIKAVSPTPTPRLGLKPEDPTAAALLSVVVPGSGQVYAGDPLKGVVIAALFGVGLWQTIDNLSLQSASDGTLSTVKDEDLGSIEGLLTLAIYGYQIQDASDTELSTTRKIISPLT
jgi:hypothetical protein